MTTQRYDHDSVVYRLEEAGATLLAMPGTGWSTRMQSSSIEIVRTAMESYGWSAARIRPPVPSSNKIARMDEAMAWLALIPPERYVLRRVVGARSLVHPITDRHLFPWLRLGAALGADHKAVQRWHAEGIDMIVRGLREARHGRGAGVSTQAGDPCPCCGGGGVLHGDPDLPCPACARVVGDEP